MQDSVEIRRREDGSIDTGHYTDEAALLRLYAIRGAAGWLGASVRAWLRGGKDNQVVGLRRLPS